MLWKLKKKGAGLEQVKRTAFKKENVYEEKLEDWLEETPDLLGEPLLIIGRQVRVEDLHDAIDLLALDPEGNAVIIELKRGKLSNPVDMQALRYASYVSRWPQEGLEQQAESYLSTHYQGTPTLEEMVEIFCDEQGVDVPPTLNEDQRIVLVGQKLAEKLGSVALWLNAHGAKVKIVEISAYKEKNQLYLEPRVVVPPPKAHEFEVGATPAARTSPWMRDGETWHRKRCLPEVSMKLSELIEWVGELTEADGPFWNQKVYVAFKRDGRNWITIKTNRSFLEVTFIVASGKFKSAVGLAKLLGVKQYHGPEDDLSAKLSLPSSLALRQRRTHDRVVLRMKDDFDLGIAGFQKFMTKIEGAFPEK